MSADASPGSQKKAILLTHYLMDVMAYQFMYHAGPNENERPEGGFPRNQWDGSEVQKWLHSTTPLNVRQYINSIDQAEELAREGFQHSDYFTGAELGALLTYPDGTGSKMTLPSGFAEVVGSDTYDKLELGAWFGSLESASNNNARKAHFKGGPSSFVEGAGDGLPYWSRSPSTSDAQQAWGVVETGLLNPYHVRGAKVAVRPACLLNLESVIFKSASDLGSPPASAAGEFSNPYILYLSANSKDLSPSATAKGDKITLIFTDYSATHAYLDTASADVFKQKFEVSKGGTPVSITSVAASGGNIILTLGTPLTVSDTGIKLGYAGYTDATSTDIIGLIKNGEGYAVKGFGSVSIDVTNSTPAPTPIPDDDNPGSSSALGVTLAHARYDGLSPADIKALLGGAALSAANLSITVNTPDGTRIPLAAGDYSVSGRNLTIFKAFLSKLGDGTHTLYLYNGSAQVGKITLTVINSTASGTSAQGSGSSGCNAGLGLFGLGAVLAGLCKVAARKKK